jgi:hypothetical protein
MRKSTYHKIRFPVPLNHKKEQEEMTHCPDCGFRPRGLNHENGIHHKTVLQRNAARRAKGEPLLSGRTGQI